MAPSFYDTESSSPSLLVSGVARPSSASKDNLPSLSVVLSLIGVLVSLILAAGICIYMFRDRLFPPTEAIVEDEKMRHSQSKGKEIISNPARSSYLSFAPNNKPAVPQVEPASVPLITVSTLRQFLLNPARPVKSTYGEVCFAQQGACQSLVDHPVASAEYNLSRCFAHRSNMSIASDYSATQMRLKASQSCPARLEEVETLFSDEDVHPHPHPQSKDPVLYNMLPTSLSLLSTSSGSTYSTYSQESDYSSDSSYPWDYYINTLHENLFYKPEPLKLPTCTPSLGADNTRLSSARVEAGISLPCKRASRKVSSRRRDTFPLKAGFLAVSQARKARRMRSRSSRFASARLHSLRVHSGDLVVVEELPFQEDSLSEDGPLSEVESQGPGTTETPDALQVREPTATDSYLLHTPPRSSSRQPFGNVTNILTTGQRQLESTSMNLGSDPEKVLSSRPSLLLNGLPADDLLTSSPPRSTRLKSPPRNPELLNTRWAPRPATPPLTITIFAKDRRNAGNKYPCRRVTLASPAGISLVELRSSVERILDRDVRMLRGMVFIRNHQMFLPIVTESFYNQWVKERVRDGGVGIVEAWLR